MFIGFFDSISSSVGATVGVVGTGAVCCGTRILRVSSRAGRPCHFFKLHHYRCCEISSFYPSNNANLVGSRVRGGCYGDSDI